MFWAWEIFSSKKSIEVINVGDEINRNKERERSWTCFHNICLYLLLRIYMINVII